jgi:hypothetical protein
MFVLVTDGSDGANETPPLVVGGNPTPSVGRRFNIFPTILGAKASDQVGFHCVDRVDNQ